MSKLSLMKKENERHRVLGAKMDMELRILEREEDIEKLKDNIAVQEKRINQLDEEIRTFKE